MNGARIAITGSSGYLGQRLVAALATCPSVEEIVGIDHRPPALHPPKLTFRCMDIRNSALADVLMAARADTVVHLAFVLNPIHDERLMRSINVDGTQNVLRAVAATRAAHFVVTSSVAAYGAWPDNPVPLLEEHPLRPNPDFQYSVNKAIVDSLCQEYAIAHPETAVAIIRPTFVLGPHVDNYFSRYLRYWPVLPVVWRGDGPMQCVHEDDLVGLCLAILATGAAGIYNLAGEGPLLWSEIIRKAGRRPVFVPGRLLSPFNDVIWRLRLPYVGAPSGQIHFTRHPCVMSCARAAAALDFRPTKTTAEALASLFRTWRRRGQPGDPSSAMPSASA